MLGGAARIQLESRLQLTHALVAVPQEFKDPDPGRMAKNSKELSLYVVDRQRGAHSDTRFLGFVYFLNILSIVKINLRVRGVQGQALPTRALESLWMPHVSSRAQNLIVHDWHVLAAQTTSCVDWLLL